MTLTRLPAGVARPELVTDWVEPGAFDELIASWHVDAPDTVGIAVQGRRQERATAWLTLGRKEEGRWTSVAGQADADARVSVDVLQAAAPLDGFRLRVQSPAGAVVHALAACTTLGPAPGDGPAATGHVARRAGAFEVPLEPLSQMRYRDGDQALDGGGASWCSPTALAMVLRRWGKVVTVPEVARAVYDPAYGGCGNWSLNVAYAASQGLDAVVTRLGSLDEARPLLEVGVPLVLAIAAAPGALPGFPIAHGTAGHLVVLAGETEAGDLVVLDPAAPDGPSVRRIYSRGPFERAWLGGSRGTVYLVRPPELSLPVGRGSW